MDTSSSAVIMQLLPSMILGVIYAIVVFVIARKRRINPWGWTIATLIPIFGLIVAAIFFLMTFLSVLDRINALEDASTSRVFG
ncbi:hypothetical protein BH11PSE1_BH11PSE1_29850 [soil metagenome]